ncbi:MAG: hypothetical protein KDD94_04305 [Calditrichaeota bacterium]|nr:hypothetical protein [Calditrichota bacterium]
MVTSFIHPVFRIIVINFKGPVTLDDLNRNFDQFIADPDFSYNMNSLVLLNDSTPQLKAGEILDHSKYIMKKKAIRGDRFKIAFVSADINSYRFMNLFGISSKDYTSNSRLFEDVESACQWLIGKRINRATLLKDYTASPE